MLRGVVGELAGGAKARTWSQHRDQERLERLDEVIAERACSGFNGLVRRTSCGSPQGRVLVLLDGRRQRPLNSHEVSVRSIHVERV
jgi:hypothetical protein